MDSGQAADLALFICCCLMLLGYNLFYFTVRAFTLPIIGKSYFNLYALNLQSRSSWVQLMSKDTKEGINAVQTVRNQVLAVSILAAAVASLASTLIRVMTDPSNLDQVQQFASIDPITDAALISPPVKMGMALGIMFLAIMALAQSVRLSIHVGYMVRVVADDPGSHVSQERLTVTLMRRSSLYFAIGLRFIFAVGPFIIYLLGPTALLIATLFDIGAQFMFDVVPAAECEEGEEGRCVQDGQGSMAVLDGMEGMVPAPALPAAAH